jgi:hypothetical protein
MIRDHRPRNPCGRGLAPTRSSGLIDGWRRELLDDWKKWNDLANMGDLTRAITTSPSYASLRPHLTESLCQRLEGRQRMLGGGQLIEEIGHIERKWKLV